jgi:hypothetical protein
MRLPLARPVFLRRLWNAFPGIPSRLMTLDQGRERYRSGEGLPPRHNEDVAWEQFPPEAYWDHNYRSLRKDDQEIINAVANHFAKRFLGARSTGRRGIDVGAGSNLYPALTMLPWCDDITVTDISPANVAWLRHGIASGREAAPDEWRWRPFWDELRRHEGYREFDAPESRLAAVARVERRSVFQLPAGGYDVGTMFFVAESMTSYETEFEDATEHFLGALRPGAVFAAAFMDSSTGYEVAGQPYPAVREVNGALVEDTLQAFGARAKVEKVDVPASDPLRDGYDGMIIAVGTTATT